MTSLREALAELVALKDIKERLERPSVADLDSGQLPDLRRKYEANKDAAWSKARATLSAEPERVGLDAIRQAIEERDAMEQKYHDLAEHMVYHGNSVSWWYSKAMAYRNAIDEVWAALREAGVVSDGKKTCADGVKELAVASADKIATRAALLAELERGA